MAALKSGGALLGHHRAKAVRIISDWTTARGGFKALGTSSAVRRLCEELMAPRKSRKRDPGLPVVQHWFVRSRFGE